MTQAQAGWYPQADGTQRYWDGSAWTDHVAPGAGQATATAPPVVAAPAEAPVVAAPPAAPSPAVAAHPAADAPQTLAAPPYEAASVPGPKKRSKLPLVLGIIGGIVALIVVAIVVLVLVVFKSTSGPRDAVNSFVAAANRDDCEGMLVVVSESYKQMNGLESCDDYEASGDSAVKYDVSETTITGSTATVSGTLTDNAAGDEYAMKFSLVKEDGDWKIDGFTSE